MLPQNIQYKFDEFVLLPHEGLLLKNGQTVSLTYRAFQVLELMVRNSNRVILKEEFMETIWENSFVEEGNLPVAINAIRKVLHNDGKVMVETFCRRGYRLNCQVEKVSIVETEKCPTIVTKSQPYQTVNEVKVLGLTKRPTPSPAIFFPRLSKVVPAKFLQLFLPAAPAPENLSYVFN
ncbi:MAG TPA: transcriptional regulator [Pyrinomonadaceae bacterium]|nr:transcriptional regulator [Pyrinomonadaceae bacterium]